MYTEFSVNFTNIRYLSKPTFNGKLVIHQRGRSNYTTVLNKQLVHLVTENKMARGQYQKQNGKKTNNIQMTSYF